MSLTKESKKYLKCTAVGDSGVGKTSLLLVYVKNSFPTDTDLMNARSRCPSLECVTINVENWTVELFDTSTNKDFERLRPLGYEGTDIFLVCFSVVMPSSVESLKKQWLPEIISHHHNAHYILVGTQIDLRDDESTIEKLAQNNQKPFTQEEGKMLAKDLKAIKYMECSVLTQEGLQELMEETIRVTQVVPKPKSKRKCLIV